MIYIYNIIIIYIYNSQEIGILTAILDIWPSQKKIGRVPSVQADPPAATVGTSEIRHEISHSCGLIGYMIASG